MRADHYLRARGIIRAVVVFGGARIAAPQAAQSALQHAGQLPTAHPDRPAAPAAAQRLVRYCHSYREAQDLERVLATARRGAGDHDFVVTTGGGPGIMEAANRGAAEAGAPTIGFNIRLPRAQLPNRWITPGLAFSFHYLALRKMHVLLRACALVGREHWARVVDFDYLVEEGFIGRDERQLVHCVDSGTEAAHYIQACCARP